jgi:large subunit ribosomal protein L31
MKPSVHPAYHHDATVTCVCGNTFVTGSTTKEIAIELCSACHPFYTGKQKLVDTGRRVEKFEERAGKKSAETLAAKKAKAAGRKSAKVAKAETTESK